MEDKIIAENMINGVFIDYTEKQEKNRKSMRL